MQTYLLVRTYKKDGSVWQYLGTEKRVRELHSYCSGRSYTDKIYIYYNEHFYVEVC